MSLKKSWKFQDLIAHESDITCVSLGHKSGKVLATGSLDKKVNLWAIGKPNCIISLAGHTTAIQCVRFNQTEEMVCAGSQSGLVKIWDLEAAKIIRTLIGHNDAVHSIDFNPSGFYLCSSSSDDNSIKFWDMRRKGCLFTFKGHRDLINDVKFSPDGQWIASGSNDYSLKLWDLRTTRILKDFNDLSNYVTNIQFHPNEFLIASATFDKKVHFWDLESFQLVSTEFDTEHLITCMSFNSEGESLFLGLVDNLRVIGWEPIRVFDQLPIKWNKVEDISLALNELIGVSYYKNSVSIYIVDLKKIRKINNNNDMEMMPFSLNQNIRKSFSKGKCVKLRHKDMTETKTIEESTSSTDLDEESIATINNIKDYSDVFRPNRTLRRTPPPNDVSTEYDFESFDSYQSLGNDNESLKIISSSENNSLHISEAESLPFEVIEAKKSFDFDRKDKEKLKLENHKTVNGLIRKTLNSNSYQIISRQTSLNENQSVLPMMKMQHSLSEVNLSTIKDNVTLSNRKQSLTSTNPSPLALTNTNFNYKSKIAVSSMKVSDKNTKSIPIDIYVNEAPLSPTLAPTISSSLPQKLTLNQSSHEKVFVTNSLDRSKGLKFDDFLPKSYHEKSIGNNSYQSMTELEKIQLLNQHTDQIVPILESRKSSLQLFTSQLKNSDLSNALDSLIQFQDLSVIADVIRCINQKSSLWSLDITVTLLPTILQLLQNKYESYIILGCDSLRIVLNNFFDLIKSNVYSSSGSFGVDITREERYKKCFKCYDTLLQIRSVINTRQNLPTHLQNRFKSFQDHLETLS